MRAVVGGVDHDGVVADAEIVHRLEDRSDRRIVLDHTVVVLGSRRQSRFVAVRVPHMRAQVHAGGVEPAEKRRVRPGLTLDEVYCRGGRFVVDRLHAFPGECAGVLDGLLADLAPARLFGRVVALRRLGAQHAARAKGLPERGIARVSPRFRVLLGVEVVEVAEELIEAMHRRQELVAVAEVVLAELAGGIAERLEQLGYGCISRLQPHGRAGNPDLRKPGAQRALAGDE